MNFLSMRLTPPRQQMIKGAIPVYIKNDCVTDWKHCAQPSVTIEALAQHTNGYGLTKADLVELVKETYLRAAVYHDVFAMNESDIDQGQLEDYLKEKGLI